MPSPNILTLTVSEILAFIRTDGNGQIDLAIDPVQEYQKIQKQIF